MSNFGHVGHRAAGIEIGQNRYLAGVSENVGAFGHKMHATKDDIFAASSGSLLRKFVRVAAEIGEADHFIALVMMPQDD